MRRLIFPEGCGYRSETGGLMERLRELTVEKSKSKTSTSFTAFKDVDFSSLVRSYHKEYYRPDNLCLIITGTFDHNRVLEALDPVEQKIIQKGPLPKMKRPWFETGNFPNLKKDIEETVVFPDEDESMGTILFAWNGPMCHVCIRTYLSRDASFELNTFVFVRIIWR